jgi:hypothetical protein
MALAVALVAPSYCRRVPLQYPLGGRPTCVVDALARHLLDIRLTGYNLVGLTESHQA